MSLKSNFRYTKVACYAGYIVQAIVINFVPLLFVTFNTGFHISLEKIALISTFSFIVQILTDTLSAKYVLKVGYRRAAVVSQIMASVGLVSYAILPFALPDAFVGIMISAILVSVGGGLIEVIINPIIDSCPADSKSGSMALLHSFYCWGQAGTVLLSTLFFGFFGIASWPVMSLIWAAVPLANAFLFALVPINQPCTEENTATPAELFSVKLFPLLLLMILCAGAAELGIAQWASAFAEIGLHTSKPVADIAGPCLFAVLMGISRVIYTLFSGSIRLVRYMTLCAVLCLVGYIAVCFSPYPFLSLAGCSLCGFSVGILWPGTLSIASRLCRRGGATMFGILAFAGDVGCTVGTCTVGFVSGLFGDDLKKGLTAAAVFPAIMIICLLICGKSTGGAHAETETDR